MTAEVGIANRSRLISGILLIFIFIVLSIPISSQMLTNGDRLFYYLQLGEKYLTELKFDKAVVAFSNALRIDPLSVNAYLGKSEAYEGLDDPDQAILTLMIGYHATKDERIQMRLVSLLEKYRSTDEWETLFPQEGPIDVEKVLQTFAPQIYETLDNQIQWQDPVFESIIREILPKPEGAIMRSELDDVKKLYIIGDRHFHLSRGKPQGVKGEDEGYYLDPNEKVYPGTLSKLDDLKNFKNLETLVIQSQPGLDISALADIEGIPCLSHLRELELTNCGITDISALLPMGSLEQNSDTYNYMYLLRLGNNKISDISPLEKFKQLNQLQLNDNMIQDISPLAGMTSLYTLNLSSNDIENIASLRMMEQIRDLKLNQNQLQRIDALALLSNLQILELSNNHISDLSPLRNLNLSSLSLVGNPVSDVSPLQNMPSSCTIYLDENLIKDWSPLDKVREVYGRPKEYKNATKRKGAARR